VELGKGSVAQKKGKVPTKKEKVSATKQDLVGFLGGLSVNLDREMNDGTILREKLRNEVGLLLEQELTNQQERMDKIPVWNKMYRGQRRAREPGLANVATPIPRILTEAIVVRIFEGLYNQPKLWIAEAVKMADEAKEEYEVWEKMAMELENDMDWWQRDINLKKKLFDPILQSVKIGKGVVMMWPKSKKRTVVRYATPAEIKSKDVPTFKLKNSPGGMTHGVKTVTTVSQQPDVLSISREDWMQSTDSYDLEDALLCGFRTYLRKPDVNLRVKQGLYDTLEADKLIAGDEIDEAKKERAVSEKKEITDHTRDKFAIWQLHYKCDVDEDGEEDDIIIVYHPESKAILRCIYNPIFVGFRPFIDFIYNPSEYAPDGEGTCEILEKLVEEMDTMHNQRIDRISQINGPILFVRDNVRGLEKFTARPRQIYWIDENLENIIQEFTFQNTVIENIREEQHLIDLCMKAVGVTPDVLGQPTADRPVFREMASRQAEANKKFRFLNRIYREKVERMGMMFLEISAQYQPTHTYMVQNGQMQEQRTITYPLEYIRDRIKVKLSGTTELDNQETRRAKAQERYMVLEKYWTSLAGMAQVIVNPYAPPVIKQFYIKASQQAEKEMEKVLQDMDMMNPEDAVMSLDDFPGMGEMANKPEAQPPPDGNQSQGAM